MVNSGVKFYQRYNALASKITPFVRSAGQSRVVESAKNWTQGYHAAKLIDRRARPRGDATFPYEILDIPEDEGLNNTLNHEICTGFEEGPYDSIADDAQAEWADIFAVPIRDRLNRDMPGANLSTIQTVYMMDICPFNTVASLTGAISDFCALFSEEEWHQYNYYMVSILRPRFAPPGPTLTNNRRSTNTTATPTETHSGLPKEWVSPTS